MMAELLALSRANLQQAWMQEKTLKMLHDIHRSVMGQAAPTLAEFRGRDDLRASVLENVTLSAKGTLTDATSQHADE